MKQVDPGVECSLYGDDFVILYKSPTIDAIQRKLQHTINRLEKWTLKNGFTITKNKTTAMHFCPDKTCMNPVFKLDNDHIQFVNEAKFLGLIWDTKLTFEPHIKYLKARCQKSLNILKVLSRTEWGADRTTLLKLYRSLVRSKLDYGITLSKTSWPGRSLMVASTITYLGDNQLPTILVSIAGV